MYRNLEPTAATTARQTQNHGQDSIQDKKLDNVQDTTEDQQKDKSIRRRVMIGTASNLAGQIVVFLVAFLLTPFLLSRLGPVVYGLWILSGSIVSYGAILDFGIWGTIIKHVAQYHAQRDFDQARRLLRTVLYFYLVICGVIGVMGMAAAPLFPLVFRLPPEQHDLARSLVILMSWATGLALPCMIPLAVLRGLQRYDLVNVITVVTSLLTAAATVTILVWGGGVIGLVLVNMSGLFVMLYMGHRALCRIAPDLISERGATCHAAEASGMDGQPSQRGDGAPRKWWAGTPLRDRQMLGVAFSYSWPLFVQDVANRLQSRTDEITIGLFLPVSQVGAYNIARRLSETSETLARQFMKTLFPLASQLHAEHDAVRLRTVYVVGTRLTLALILMLGAVLITLAGPILTMWVGAEYAVYAGVVAILALAHLIVTVRWSAVAILQAMARHRILAVSSLTAGLANLGLSLWLVHPLGLTGVALGTVIPIALEYFCVILPFSLYVTGVRFKEVVSEVFVPALLPAVPMLLVLYGLRMSFAPVSLPAILAVSVAGLFTYVVTYLALARDVERRWCDEMMLYLRRVHPLRLKRS